MAETPLPLPIPPARVIRAVDFFCGIGGNHVALERACAVLGLGLEVVLAFDLSPNCKEVYSANHKCGCFHQKNVQSITPEMLDAIPADIWLMSPPCQPHTRNGRQEDLDDPRSDGFVAILHILRSVKNRPAMLFLENVRDFATSKSRDQLVASLVEVGMPYVKEVLINPKDAPFLIPNSRLRYYCLASSVAEPLTPTTATSNPLALLKHEPVLSSYLEGGATIPIHALIPPGALRKRALMDIVTSSSDRCCCFTKGYTRAAEGSGSVIDVDGTGTALRYFTPREIANLLGFPPSFVMDGVVTVKQQYGLLGNSVSVHVVAALLHDLIANF